MSRRDRVLYVDATAGAAGDMILGALIDLGVPAAHVRRAIETLPLDGWKLVSRRIRRASLAARRVDVRVAPESRGRRWRDVQRILRAGKLDTAVRDRALAIFRRLFEAEAEVHGESPERVHLHEAGAVDAIVDIVGASVGLARLAPRKIVVSTLTTGFGTVRCQHGELPVPAPATTLLVRGAPVRAGRVEVERLTPTGAAILTTVADAWGTLPAMRPLAVGYGAGRRELDGDANVLRMVLGEALPDSLPDDEADGRGDSVLVIHASIDDATPQLLAYAAERLLRAGALEVYTTAVLMKKGRAGHELTVLARPAVAPEIFEVLLRETSTLGLRYRTERRIELERSVEIVSTPYGKVAIKIGRLEHGPPKGWPEYDDCAALARRAEVPLGEVQRAALAAWSPSSASRSGTREREKPSRRKRGR